MGRLFLCDLNVFVILCEGEEKCEENQVIFRNKYLKNCFPSILIYEVVYM